MHKKLSPHEIARIIEATGSDIEFNAKDHAYMRNGLRLPSVTTVLGVYNRVASPSVPRWVISTKGITGSIIHAITERIDAGVSYDDDDIITDAMRRGGVQLNEENVDLFAEEYSRQLHRIDPYIEGYRKFCSFYKPSWLLKEQVVSVLDRRPFAGTLDRFGVLEERSEKPVLLDIKTTLKPSPSHGIQVVAYGMSAGNWMYDMDYAILYLRKDGTYHLDVITDPEEIGENCYIFKGLRFLYDALENVEHS